MFRSPLWPVLSLSLALFSCLALPVFADGPTHLASDDLPSEEVPKELPSDDLPVTNDEVDVWATEISASSLSLGDDEIALEQVDHLSDLLRDLPGVDIGGTHSTNQRINIRGLDDRDLEVTLDGASQTNYMFHHMGNLLLNTDILKTVDIEVGAQSVATGGLGGAVRFETKDAPDLLVGDQRFGARVRSIGHSNAAVGYSAVAYGRLGERFDAMLYGQRIDRDDFEDGRGFDSSGNDGTTDNVLVKVGYRLAPNHRLELSFDDLLDEGLYAPRPDFNGAANDRINAARDGSKIPTRYGRETTTLGWDGLFQSTFGIDTAVRARLYDTDSTLERGEPGDISSGTSVHRGLRLTADTAKGRHGVTWGVLADEQQSRYRIDADDTTNDSALSAAVFVQDQIAIGPRVRLTPGLRYDRYALDTLVSDETYTHISGALAAEIDAYQDATSRLTLSAGSAQVFKGPELAEIFIGGERRKIPNPALEPESGWNHEVGLRYTGRQHLGFDSLSLALTVFRTDIDDFIDSVSVTEGCAAGARCSQDQNLGTVEIEGAEASVFATRGPWRGLLTFATSHSNVGPGSEPLEREVGDSVSGSLDYLWERADLELSWSVQRVFDEDDVLPGLPVKEGYEVHDLAARWRPDGAAGLSLTLGVDNLFDEAYASHASRYTSSATFGDLTDYEPGRNLKATLAYTF